MTLVSKPSSELPESLEAPIHTKEKQMPWNTDVLKNMKVYVATDKMRRGEQSLAGVIKILMESTDVDLKHRRQLVDIALWKYTEASGMHSYPKYNLRYVSDGARNLNNRSKLNHEHVWSRLWILDRLFGKASWEIDDLSDFLRKYAVACVVTIGEHGLLGDKTAIGWNRYAKAGISVWDRQEKAHLDLQAATPTIAQRLTAAQPPSPVELFDLQDLIVQRAKHAAPYLQRLTRTARFMSAVSVVSVRKIGEPSKHFRVSDALLGEPTRAVAYPHWTGRVDFGLIREDVPGHFMGEPSVKERKHPVYGVSCKVTDEASFEVAEELLFLALEKVRAGAEPAEV